jgi:hypothetical protein
MASTESRRLLASSGRIPKTLTNRECIRCRKRDLAASRIEADFEARRKTKGRLS